MTKRIAIYLTCFIYGIAATASTLAERLQARGLSPRSYQLMTSKIASRHYAKQYVGIFDYSLSSSVPRFFLIDLKSETFKTYSASHGMQSGGADTVCVSNASGSNQTSLGFSETVAHSGKWNPSLGLHSLSAGNSNDESRAIILHGAEYATAAFANQFGFMGRSLGCRALSPDDAAEVVGKLGVGALLLTYHDALWDEAQAQPAVEHCVGGKRPSFQAPTAWEVEENRIGVNAFKKIMSKYESSAGS